MKLYGSKGLCSKTAFLKWAWQRINVLSRPESGYFSFRLDKGSFMKEDSIKKKGIIIQNGSVYKGTGSIRDDTMQLALFC